MTTFFSLTGAVFLFYGICLCAFSNFNLGVILVVLFGALLVAYGVFHKKIAVLTQKGILKYVKYMIIFCITAEFMIVGFLAIYGQRDNVTYKEDAIVVLGAGIKGERLTLPLKYRLDTAIEYSEKNPNAIIVVSGGQGFQETVTEASVMKKYLLLHGVSEDKIVEEGKATSTNENMRFSKEILDKKFGAPYSIAVITNGFHIYRGVSISHREGFENVTHLHAGLQWYNLLPCYLRESLAVVKMWLLG